jgi:peptide/nickel transport system permease protein
LQVLPTGALTSSSTSGDLLRFGLTRLIQALGLAVSVVLLLFLILESGVAGDPALRVAGEHSSPQRLADARLQLGFFEQWQPELLHLELHGPAARYYLDFPSTDVLEIQSVRHEVVHRLDLTGKSIADVAAEITTLQPTAGEWQHQISVNLDASASGHLSAEGLAHAQKGVAIPLQSNRTSTLAWAEPRPAWKRFATQTAALLRFDFGRSADGQSIAEQLRSRGARSLALTLPAFVLGTLLSVFAALLSTRKRWGERLATLCLLGMTISSMAWVLLLRNWFAADLGWFPVAGWQEPFSKYLILPTLIWALLYFFPSYLIFRQLFQSDQDQDFVAAAEAKGVHGWPLLWNHIAKPAGAPVIAQIILVLPFLVVGSLLLERVFVIPGLGSYTVDAAITGDAAVLRATTFLIALMYLLCQWLGDWITVALDPRTRRGEGSE